MVKSGGWVVISVPNMRHINVLATLAIKGDWPEAAGGIFDSTHLQVMTHRRLSRWCEMAGLRRERWFSSYGYWRTRKVLYRIADRLTFGLLKSFFVYEVQGLFRRL
jgi:aminoglycoside phosphotransferase (APT) family kinase protein